MPSFIYGFVLGRLLGTPKGGEVIAELLGVEPKVGTSVVLFTIGETIFPTTYCYCFFLPNQSENRKNLREFFSKI